MATEKELQQENEKLTARLNKAVQVFNEQKATITRQAEEIESLKQKAAEGEKKDNEFFDQVKEIEDLKGSLARAVEELTNFEKAAKKKEADYEVQLTAYKKSLEETTRNLEKSNKRLEAIKALVNKELE